MATSTGVFEQNSLGSGKACSYTTYFVKKTGIADNTATPMVTVTVPNGNHSIFGRVIAGAITGGADAFEGSAARTKTFTATRTTGANVVAGVSGDAAATIANASVSGGATWSTLVVTTGSVAGAVGAVNTFTIDVTANNDTNVDDNTLFLYVELLNAENSGVTLTAV